MDTGQRNSPRLKESVDEASELDEDQNDTHTTGTGYDGDRDMVCWLRVGRHKLRILGWFTHIPL